MTYLRARYYSSEYRRLITEDPIRDGSNWYAYAGNNPVMFVDPSGEDAIILTNTYGAEGYGHMGVLVQDCNGTWVYFSCGENYSVWVAVDPAYMSDLYTFSDEYYAAGRYTESTYIKGDFTNACNYYYEYNNQFNAGNNQYNLIFNNCSQVVMDGLNKSYLDGGMNVGEFTGNYRGTIPNHTQKNMREMFFNNAWDYTTYRKQLNDQLWEVTNGMWYNRSKYIANRIRQLDKWG